MCPWGGWTRTFQFEMFASHPNQTDALVVFWCGPAQRWQANRSKGAHAASAKSAALFGVMGEWRDQIYWAAQRSAARVTWKECSVAGAQTHTAATVIIQVSIETTSASHTALEPQKPSGTNLSSQKHLHNKSSRGRSLVLSRKLIVWNIPPKYFAPKMWLYHFQPVSFSQTVAATHKRQDYQIVPLSPFLPQNTSESLNQHKRSVSTRTAAASTTNAAFITIAGAAIQSFLVDACSSSSHFAALLPVRKRLRKPFKSQTITAWQAEN